MSQNIQETPRQSSCTLVAGGHDVDVVSSLQHKIHNTRSAVLVSLCIRPDIGLLSSTTDSLFLSKRSEGCEVFQDVSTTAGVCYVCD